MTTIDPFAQFHHEWDVSFDIAPPPKGSQDLETTADGADGGDGARGRRGDSTTGPGPGHDGHDGKNSQSLTAHGDGLIFHKNHLLTYWIESATAGFGGNGGNGGNAGPFDPSFDSGPWPSGGDGGAGGDSGNASALLTGRTLYVGTGTYTQFSLGATTRHAGNGGNGGNGDGETSPVSEPGGNGGNGAAGGDAGDAIVTFRNDTITPVTNTDNPKDFSFWLELLAEPGNGGDGGDGGHGGVDNLSVNGGDGTGAKGGDGGASHIVISDDTFHIGGRAGGTGQLTIEALAYSGDGGGGGSTAGNPSENFAAGGHGGNTTIEMSNLHVIGGAANDTVSIDLETLTGTDGVNGDGTFDGLGGTSTYIVKHNVFDGGNGNNTLSFAVSVDESGFSVNVDLVRGLFFVNGDKGGTIAHFRNVTGAGGDDYLRGNGLDNTLTGGSGSDRMIGGGGADTFFYNTHYESWAYGWDTLPDINFNVDKISLPFAVKHIDATVTGAELHSDTFISDMTATLNGHLHVGHAILVEGEYHEASVVEERAFLVVDADGLAGYTYEDMVLDVTGFHGKLKVATFVDHGGT